MNKYTAIGLLDAAAQGKRMIVVAPQHRAVRQAFDEVLPLCPPSANVQRSSGREMITLPQGGWIRFTSRTRVRGMSCDEVLLEDDRDYSPEVLALIATSPHGEIVRY